MGIPSSSVVKNPPAMQEIWVQVQDPLEKEMATHSSILAWEIPWTEESLAVHGQRRAPTVHGVTKSQTGLKRLQQWGRKWLQNSYFSRRGTHTPGHSVRGVSAYCCFQLLNSILRVRVRISLISVS